MKIIEKCIICNSENEREYYDNGPIGRVEENYYCENCGYYSVMSYGPSIQGIDILSGKKRDRKRKRKLLKKNYDLIKKFI